MLTPLPLPVLPALPKVGVTEWPLQGRQSQEAASKVSVTTLRPLFMSLLIQYPSYADIDLYPLN